MAAAPKIKGVSYEFANGETYIVPPLSLGHVEMLQERLEKFGGGLDKESIATVVDAAWMALQRNYPQITREKVRDELIDLGNFQEAMMLIMDVGGLRRKEAQQQGEDRPGS